MNGFEMIRVNGSSRNYRCRCACGERVELTQGNVSQVVWEMNLSEGDRKPSNKRFERRLDQRWVFIPHTPSRSHHETKPSRH